jgi:hypothetical protein
LPSEARCSRESSPGVAQPTEAIKPNGPPAADHPEQKRRRRAALRPSNPEWRSVPGLYTEVSERGLRIIGRGRGRAARAPRPGSLACEKQLEVHAPVDQHAGLRTGPELDHPLKEHTRVAHGDHCAAQRNRVGERLHSPGARSGTARHGAGHDVRGTVRPASASRSGRRCG